MMRVFLVAVCCVLLPVVSMAQSIKIAPNASRLPPCPLSGDYYSWNGTTFVCTSGSPPESPTTGITFEGATADDFETTLSIADPTADNDVIVPDLSGTVALLGPANVGTFSVGGINVDELSALSGGAIDVLSPGSGLVSFKVRTQTGIFVFADDAGQPTFRDDQDNNAIDLGAPASLFKNIYIGTTLFAPLVRSAADTDLTIQAIGTTGEMLFNATEGYSWGFDGAVGDNFILHLNELAPDLPALYPFATGGIDLGAVTNEFNDIYIAGAVTVGGDEGITDSGTSCTITEIKGGIITGATCI